MRNKLRIIFHRKIKINLKIIFYFLKYSHFLSVHTPYLFSSLTSYLHPADMTSFNAFFAKGNVLKVLMESLQLAVTRVHLSLTEKGIYIRDYDAGHTILYDIEFQRENLKDYICERERVISVCVKQFYKQLKNVKKKDSITLFIPAEGDDQLGILIQPEDNKNESGRSEKNFVLFNDELDYTPIDIPANDEYEYPMVIEASEFQKIKKMIGSSRKICIQIQRSNYISFQAGDSELLKSTIFFGKLMSPDGTVAATTTTGTGTTPPLTGIYDEPFNSSNINMLIKFPGMCSTMQFYAPREKGLPLRLKINAGQNNTLIGTVQIFIKDTNTIALEHSMEDLPPVMEQPKRGRAKKVKA